MLHFQMCNILKFTQNSLVVLIPYLLIYSQQFFVTTLLRNIAFMRNVFCFNGFNQPPIVLRYPAHIKPRKRLGFLLKGRHRPYFTGILGVFALGLDCRCCVSEEQRPLANYSCNYFRTSPTYMLTVPQSYGRTDGQTDGQTDGRLTIAIPRYHCVHRAVKSSSYPFMWKIFCKDLHVDRHICVVFVLRLLPAP